jgi:hypothetical protein
MSVLKCILKMACTGSNSASGFIDLDIFDEIENYHIF